MCQAYQIGMDCPTGQASVGVPALLEALVAAASDCRGASVAATQGPMMIRFVQETNYSLTNLVSFRLRRETDENTVMASSHIVVRHQVLRTASQKRRSHLAHQMLRALSGAARSSRCETSYWHRLLILQRPRPSRTRVVSPSSWGRAMASQTPHQSAARGTESLQASDPIAHARDERRWNRVCTYTICACISGLGTA